MIGNIYKKEHENKSYIDDIYIHLIEEHINSYYR